jgi:hypothetical protein
MLSFAVTIDRTPVFPIEVTRDLDGPRCGSLKQAELLITDVLGVDYSHRDALKFRFRRAFFQWTHGAVDGPAWR